MAMIIAKILAVMRTGLLSALAVQVIFFMSSGCVEKKEVAKNTLLSRLAEISNIDF